MREIFLSWLIQLASSLGVIVIAGFLIALLNRFLYKRLGSCGQIVCCATGIVGTPIHEGAHALMCLLFGHKITEIKFFQIGSADGTLGYVQHSYNPGSFYQKMGNLFIGTAPVFVGGAVIALLQYFLLPDVYVARGRLLAGLDFSRLTFSRVREMLLAQLDLSTEGIDSWQWWVFTVLAALIAMHMTLSKEDLQGALSGLFIYLLLLFVADLVLGFFFPSVLALVTDAFFTFGMLLVQCLLPALVLLVLLIGLTYASSGIRRLAHR